ncbi:unnamed protein product, partial [Prorocentrum cordatum]
MQSVSGALLAILTIILRDAAERQWTAGPAIPAADCGPWSAPLAPSRVEVTCAEAVLQPDILEEVARRLKTETGECRTDEHDIRLIATTTLGLCGGQGFIFMALVAARRPLHLSDTGRPPSVQELSSSLRPGCLMAIEYGAEDLWHERVAVGPGLQNAEGLVTSWWVLTPDGDFYEEDISMEADEGKRMMLLDMGKCLYRFEDGTTPADARVRQEAQQAAARMRAVGQEPPALTHYVTTESELAPLRGVGRRLRRRDAEPAAAVDGAATPVLPPPSEAPAVEDAGVLDGRDSVAPYLAVLPERAAPRDGRVWLISENAEGHETLGMEATPRAGDIFVTSTDGLVHRHGSFLRVQAVPNAECAEFVQGLRARRGGTAAAAGPSALRARASDPPPALEDDVRTLWVDYDEVGERFKSWKKAVQEGWEEPITAVQVQGPPGALHLARHMARRGGDPRRWWQEFARGNGISKSDRVHRKMISLTESYNLFGEYDQLNLGASAGIDKIARGMLGVIDAYSAGGGVPSWRMAAACEGEANCGGAIAPALRKWGVNKLTGHNEIESTRTRCCLRQRALTLDAGKVPLKVDEGAGADAATRTRWGIIGRVRALASSSRSRWPFLGEKLLLLLAVGVSGGSVLVIVSDSLLRSGPGGRDGDAPARGAAPQLDENPTNSEALAELQAREGARDFYEPPAAALRPGTCWSLAPGRERAGLFSVREKNGKLRLIFDARRANRGFSWGTFLARDIDEEVAGLVLERGELLRGRGRPLAPTARSVDASRARHYIYVNNIGVFGSDGNVAAARLEDVCGAFEARGLAVHEVATSDSGVEALGALLDGRRRRTGLTAKRFWRVRGASLLLAGRRRASGRQVEVALGRATFCGLVRRETLSAFATVRPSIRKHYDQPVALWPSVADELRVFAGPMALLVSRWESDWNPLVVAAGVSETGCGICPRCFDAREVAAIGRCRERDRYLAEDHAGARAAALGETSPPAEPLGVAGRLGRDGLTADPCFDEVSSSMTKQSSWAVVGGWRFREPEDIVVLEARAMLRGSRDRFGRNIRRLLFADNLGLALAVSRWRCRNFKVLAILRSSRVAGAKGTAGARALARSASQPDLSEAGARRLLGQLRAPVNSDPRFAEASSSESEEADAEVHQFSTFANVSRVTDIPLETLGDLAQRIGQGVAAARDMKLLAGAVHVQPKAGEQGPRALRRNWRALKGRQNLSPSTSRLPEARPIWCAVVNGLRSLRRSGMAFFICLTWSAYARPVQLMALRPEFLRAPSREFDATIELDHSWWAEIAPMLDALKSRPPGERVWTPSYPQLAATVQEVAHGLGFNLVVYQARHSGASSDMSPRRRTLAEAYLSLMASAKAGQAGAESRAASSDCGAGLPALAGPAHDFVLRDHKALVRAAFERDSVDLQARPRVESLEAGASADGGQPERILQSPGWRRHRAGAQ